MKIYFTAATTINGELTPQYKKIISILKKDHKLVSGEQIVQKSQLAKDKKLGWSMVFEREKKRIDSADCVVVEVSKPSTGVGGEIVYALLHNKPVLALVHGELEDKLTPMVAGNPSQNLYLEHYDKDNLALKIKDFLTHVKRQKNRHGKLIVIDGGDGSGKTTQGKLLVKRLTEQGILAKFVSFPRYYSSFHGAMVAQYLRGEFGSLNQVSPYLVALTYAIDRAQAREEIEQFLARGGIVICDRYTTSSMAHLSANLSPAKRNKFINWIDELEYRQHKMPRPDKVIYLYVPRMLSDKLTKKGAKTRRYSNKADIHENNQKHRIEAEKMYLKFCKQNKNWEKINCVKDNKLKPISTISRDIDKIIKLVV